MRNFERVVEKILKMRMYLNSVENKEWEKLKRNIQKWRSKERRRERRERYKSREYS
jgi:hypothetical protein